MNFNVSFTYRELLIAFARVVWIRRQLSAKLVLILCWFWIQIAISRRITVTVNLILFFVEPLTNFSIQFTLLKPWKYGTNVFIFVISCAYTSRQNRDAHSAKTIGTTNFIANRLTWIDSWPFSRTHRYHVIRDCRNEAYQRVIFKMNLRQIFLVYTITHWFSPVKLTMMFWFGFLPNTF